jgi:beta-lactamase class A
MGVGLGVITGTGLRLLAPRLALGASSQGATPREPAPGFGAAQAGPGGRGAAALGSFEPRIEITALSRQWQRLAAKHKDLTASGYLLVLDDGRFAQLQSTVPLPAASSIKTPILLVALQSFDNGRLSWNEALPMTKEVVGGGAGWMASRPVGTRFPFFEAATEMIRVSDNTATNLLIKRLGGKTAVNAQFTALGLGGTVINNWLPDLRSRKCTDSKS